MSFQKLQFEACLFGGNAGLVDLVSFHYWFLPQTTLSAVLGQAFAPLEEVDQGTDMAEE